MIAEDYLISAGPSLKDQFDLEHQITRLRERLALIERAINMKVQGGYYNQADHYREVWWETLRHMITLQGKGTYEI